MIRRTAAYLARILASQLRGDGAALVTGVAIDSRAVRPGDLFVALRGARADGHDFARAAAASGASAALVMRPLEVDVVQVVVADTATALLRIAANERAEAAYRLAAIAGSIGKTSTKEILASLLGTTFRTGFTSGNRNSETGFPVEVCNQPDGIEWMVAELAMSHAGELDRLGAVAQPNAVLYTVVAPVHLEFFRDIGAIAEAKAELIDHLSPEGVLVLNAADPRVASFAARFDGSVLRYGVPDRSDLWIGSYEERGLLGSRFELTGALGRVEVDCPLAGRHQADNVLAAATLALAVGVPDDRIASAVTRLRPAHRRGEIHRIDGEVTLVDDSYNSSPEAAKALLALLAATKGRRVAVLGEMLELGPTSAALHREVGRRVATSADVVVAVGGPPAADLASAANGIEAHRTSTVEEALNLVRKLLRPGDVVLVKGSRGIGLDRLVDGLLEGVR
ncbi:MAG: UDP-N-acetylmuramoyl-tripeptide--D-alanyl-D-alanine ligase [Acidobacteriia bacterium]|nr:UDP-N-acetylmuramoyl-tripeptide--D-alanyl-D-alanine ligase [Terriglobia bacterium]